MTSKPVSPLWAPGTDPLTGWPVEPKHPCPKGQRMVGLEKGQVLELIKAEFAINEANKALEVLCHLQLSEGPMECRFEPKDCPFYGRWPKR